MLDSAPKDRKSPTVTFRVRYFTLHEEIKCSMVPGQSYCVSLQWI
jgi:hypothetical protein